MPRVFPSPKAQRSKVTIPGSIRVCSYVSDETAGRHCSTTCAVISFLVRRGQWQDSTFVVTGYEHGRLQPRRAMQSKGSGKLPA